MSLLNQEQLAALRGRLDARERELQPLYQQGRDRPSSNPAREPQDLVDTAEGVNEELDRAALQQHYRGELNDIAQARERIDAGEYGVCQDCERKIPYARLLANPTATRCAPCQERRERTFAS
ncbi:TraR/DksA family transcriptional regulator [Cupriavidus sp. DB3]|uniref:TraR/DksA family transcriptional regulator n=1 Tax=Cupriavidus sp. DB3 TaxID=2873259 RepID=UPI001CF3AEF7|nr:TraR/DksA C4-type zinc finger protein [Cupriavidus sp. DB3]MCA7082739.1 TraR/DksA family transcriptional regulator [Cupriavidus sp. DB3]